MNTDRDQIKQLGEIKRKVYTLEKKQGNTLSVSMTTPNIEQALELYSAKIQQAVTEGCYIEHQYNASPKKVLGKEVVQKMTITTQGQDTIEWILLCEET